MEGKIKPTSIRIDEKLLEKITNDAKKEKRSVSKQIEYIVQQYYEMKKMMS